MPEDCGLRWKRSRVFQYVFKRKFTVPCECNATCEATRVPADLLQPKFLVGRIAVHHCHGLGVSGNTRRMLSKTAVKLFATATTVSFGMECTQILNECSFVGFIAGTGSH